MKEFYNPYHFVPIKPGPRPGDVSCADFKAGRLGQATHDASHPEARSGRIVCRLTAESPLVVGAAQREGTPSVVEPYRLDGEVAIPSSSLRGMLSALAEAASNSAARILQPRQISFRQDLDNSLSALGMLAGSDESGWHLIPLTLPTICAAGRRYPLDGNLTVYRDLYDHAALRVYIGNGPVRGQPDPPAESNIYDPAFFARSFVLDDPVHGRVWGMRLAPRRPIGRDGSIAAGSGLRVAGKYLIGQELAGGSERDCRIWSEIPTPQRSEYVPGVFRVLGGWGRNAHLPRAKKHELFLPIPIALERFIDSASLLHLPPVQTLTSAIAVADDAISRFADLARERAEAVSENDQPLLPFEPKDTRPDRQRSETDFKLRPGDIVYFRAECRDNRIVASEIAFSACWRSRVETDTNGRKRPVDVRDFFASHGSVDHLPFHPHRTNVTPAELLFGFVENTDPERTGIKPNRDQLALAGRLRIGPGRLAVAPQRPDAPLLPGVTLKILSSPKPPSPALYFRNIRPPFTYTAKCDLSLAKHTVQGRKFYLHATQNQVRTESWRSRILQDEGDFKSHLKQKLLVTPVSSQTAFWFHIDFENLTDRELGLLLYTLEPSPGFQHKLGLGKPLGLGSVKVEVMAVCGINPVKRYSPDGFRGARYHEVWRRHDAPRAARGYTRELSVPVTPRFNPELLRDAYRDSMSPSIHRAICLIGEPRQDHPVQQPLLERQWRDKASEHETFSWSVWNDRTSHQWLDPLDAEPDTAQKAAGIVLRPLTTD